ncbi:class I SAM-dependent methyltransferase [Echinicola jeungdonensis]|uniref:Class I SAM-dependent methyltransferase n=1 Tax=Echinicola jeungdonensis TaxID=709343 RepID=A0ABV5J8T5_9BACT|nr:class I SAM-dependent methyltransferase [Echinicola jeungdonensis]MDN3669209.1 class I SAM-dependent methyltransferase [Echinicola jeungdonensis]
MNIQALNQLLGNIDIYLLDQILKGRFDQEMKILDAGCGEGRNLIYLIKEGYQAFGVDQNPTAIQMTRTYAKTIKPKYDVFRFQVAQVEDLPFHKGAFEAVISSAVLHFAQNKPHFFKQFDEMMRVLQPEGILFLRMTTGFGGMQERAIEKEGGVYVLPDGSQRFLMTKSILEQLEEEYNLHHLEQPKSVLVHDQRAMGVFVMQKGTKTNQMT